MTSQMGHLAPVVVVSAVQGDAVVETHPLPGTRITTVVQPGGHVTWRQRCSTNELQ